MTFTSGKGTLDSNNYIIGYMFCIRDFPITAYKLCVFNKFYSYISMRCHTIFCMEIEDKILENLK